MTLDPRARELLEAFRREESPSAGTLQRLLGVVESHPPIAPPPNLDVDPRAVSTPGAAAAAGVAKLALVTLAVTVPVAWYFVRPESPPPLPVSTREDVKWTVVPSAVPPRPSAPVLEKRPLNLSDLPLVPSSKSVVPRASTSSVAPPPPPAVSATADPLTEEVSLLAAANEALAGGDPSRALTLVARHSLLFPRSRLGDARTVTRAVALCQAGRRAEGRAAAEAFLRARPASPFAERLRSSCGVP